jgi:hypothetical protein
LVKKIRASLDKKAIMGMLEKLRGLRRLFEMRLLYELQ